MEKASILGNIKWIFFDVGSTLVDESLAYEHRIRTAIEGTDITYEAFLETMLPYYYRGEKGDFETMKQFGLMKPRWYHEDERLYPDAKECLEKLSAKYHIGVIANQSLGTAKRLEDFGIGQYIELVIASAEEGVAKPDPEIFRRALQRAGCQAEEAVMIGDRLDNDVLPAKQLGMKTIWCRQGFGGLLKEWGEDAQPDLIVQNLQEVCELLMNGYTIKTLQPNELPILTELCDYNDVADMIEENTRNIETGLIDIFVLFHESKLIGELHVKYESEDEREAVRGRRAYLFAFRVREEMQGRGIGAYLLQSVLDTLEKQGYTEFTIGVEDDNERAIHMYQSAGFDKVIARKAESYQGDSYEYNLYLKSINIENDRRS